MSQRSGLARWLTTPASPADTRLLMGAFAALVVTVAAVAVALNWRKPNMDYRNLYRSGLAEWRGEGLYEYHRRGSTFDFIYPPASAALIAPLAAMGPRAMAVALISLLSVAWWASALLSAYLVTGRALGQAPALYLVPVAVTLPYVWDNYVLGQPNLFLLGLMLGMFACLKARRGWAAGALLALATAIKAFPVAAVVYLVWRRQWRAVASTVVVGALLLLVLPAPLRGLRGNYGDLVKWSRGMLLNNDAEGVGQRPNRSYSWQNQSLLGVVHRLVRHVDANQSRKPAMFVNVVDLTFGQAMVLVGLSVGMIGVVYLLAMPPAGRRTELSDAVEWGALLVMILVFSPYLFGYFNCWLMYPIAVMTYLYLAAPEGGGTRRGIGVLGVVVLGLLVTGVPVRPFYWPQALGNVLWADLLLLGAMLWRLAGERGGVGE